MQYTMNAAWVVSDSYIAITTCYTPHASGVGEYIVVILKNFLILSNDTMRW